MTHFVPRKIGKPFRIAAGTLGPLLGLAGLYVLGATVYNCVVGECPSVWGWIKALLEGAGNLALAYILLEAAITGLDPLIGDVVEDD